MDNVFSIWHALVFILYIKQSVKYTTYLLHITATYNEKSFFNSVQPDGYVDIADTYSSDVLNICCAFDRFRSREKRYQ